MNVDPQIHHEEKEVDELDEDLSYHPTVANCRTMEMYECLDIIGQGAFGVVHRAWDRRTEQIVAMKSLKVEAEYEELPLTFLREINTLRRGQHKNVITFREVVFGNNINHIAIVMECARYDIRTLMDTMRQNQQRFSPAEVKCLLQQLLEAVAHLHNNWILHRDLKPGNLFLSYEGILKIGDFGMAREYRSSLKPHSPELGSLWYRAPELLQGNRFHGSPIDIWSVGCIFGELILMDILFPGLSQKDQLIMISEELGIHSTKCRPGFYKPAALQRRHYQNPVSSLRIKMHSLPQSGFDFLLRFLTFDPARRIMAKEALRHSYFAETPLPIDPANFPIWPINTELK